MAMPRKTKALIEQALEPLSERAELARQLLDSLENISEEENNALWAVEAERRSDDYKAGKIEATPAEEVFARLRARNR